MAGQLRWYILRDLNDHHHKRHKLDFEDARKHRATRRIGLVREKLSRIDPLHPLTESVMEHTRKAHLPKSLQGSLERLFARCPHEFLDFYREMRAVAEELASRRHRSPKAR